MVGEALGSAEEETGMAPSCSGGAAVEAALGSAEEVSGMAPSHSRGSGGRGGLGLSGGGDRDGAIAFGRGGGVFGRTRR